MARCSRSLAEIQLPPPHSLSNPLRPLGVWRRTQLFEVQRTLRSSAFLCLQREGGSDFSWAGAFAHWPGRQHVLPSAGVHHIA